jgi:DNA-binding transcriptional ArsR family regulator
VPHDTAALFAALGDDTRLGLVTRLAAGPQSLARLTETTRVTRQAVRKHLRVLERAGVVRSKRSGRESVWRLQAARLEEARRHLARIAARWDSAVARLRKMVEETAG